MCVYMEKFYVKHKKRLSAKLKKYLKLIYNIINIIYIRQQTVFVAFLIENYNTQLNS